MSITHYQQEHSKTCGIAAIRMVLSSFGDFKSEQELLQGITIHSYGIFSAEMALPLLSQGYKIKAYTFNLPILGQYKLTNNAVIQPDQIISSITVPSLSVVAKSQYDFISAGGEMIWHPPTIDLLISTTKQGLSPLISVNTAALGDYWRHWNNGHYLVVTEVVDHKAHVFDPYFPDDTGDYWLEVDRLLAAWTINSIRSTDHCMIISK